MTDPLHRPPHVARRAARGAARRARRTSSRRRCWTSACAASATPTTSARPTGSSCATRRAARAVPSRTGRGRGRAASRWPARSRTTRPRPGRTRARARLRARAAERRRGRAPARSVLATDGATDAVAFAAHVLALNEVEGEVAHVGLVRARRRARRARAVRPRAGRRRALHAGQRRSRAATVPAPGRARRRAAPGRPESRRGAALPGPRELFELATERGQDVSLHTAAGLAQRALGIHRSGGGLTTRKRRHLLTPRNGAARCSSACAPWSTDLGGHAAAPPRGARRPGRAPHPPRSAG